MKRFLFALSIFAMLGTSALAQQSLNHSFILSIVNVKTDAAANAVQVGVQDGVMPDEPGSRSDRVPGRGV